VIAATHHYSLHNSQAYIANRSIVVNHVEKAIQERKAAIAYIYCDYKDAKTQFEVEILSSITRQLIEQISLMSSEMKTFHDKNIQKRRNSTDDEWISLLRSLCLLFQTIYVFIDALITFSYLIDSLIIFKVIILRTRIYTLNQIEKSFSSSLQEWSLSLECLSSLVHTLIFKWNLLTYIESTFWSVSLTSRHSWFSKSTQTIDCLCSLLKISSCRMKSSKVWMKKRLTCESTQRCSSLDCLLVNINSNDSDFYLLIYRLIISVNK